MMKRVVITGVAAAMMLGGAAEAQVKRNLLGSYKKWDAFVETDPEYGKACYMASSPDKTAASKANVRRGEIYITVTHRKKYGVKNQVNVVFGYPMAEKATVTLSVDGRGSTEFFTQKDDGGNSTGWAWDDKGDSDMVARMKRGNSLVVKGASARGTRTTDTYSLSGFTAAYNAITKACG